MRVHGIGLATLGGLWMALPAFAGGPVYQPPAGCSLEMTVQLRACQVVNHFRCSADPAGERHASFADGQGEFFQSHIDAETQWLESRSPRYGERNRLDAGQTRDPASFSELLATGRDAYDFVTLSQQGETRRYTGFDELTGQTVTVDGIALERTRFRMRVVDGAGKLVALREGRQFINREMRLFFGDAENMQNAEGDTTSSYDAPVTFAFPGDKDFGATKPEYDCDMMMTDMSPNHDHPTL